MGEQTIRMSEAPERAMLGPVTEWLKQAGMEIAAECLLHGYCDVVGFEFAERTSREIPPLVKVVAVELKRGKPKDVFLQAQGTLHFVNASYAGMPADACAKMRPPTIERFRSAGIGLLAVDWESVEVFVEPSWMIDGRENRLRRKWWRWHRQNQREARMGALDRGRIR